MTKKEKAIGIGTTKPDAVLMMVGTKLSSTETGYFTEDHNGKKRSLVSNIGETPYIVCGQDVYTIYDIGDLIKDHIQDLPDGTTISIAIGCDDETIKHKVEELYDFKSRTI